MKLSPKYAKLSPDPNIFLWIPVSVAQAAAVNPNRMEKLLASGLCTFFIKGNPIFSNGSKSLSKNPSDCPILCNWILKLEKLEKSLETCNNWCE